MYSQCSIASNIETSDQQYLYTIVQMPELTSTPEHMNNDNKLNDQTRKAKELLLNLQGEIAKRSKLYKISHQDVKEKIAYSCGKNGLSLELL